MSLKIYTYPNSYRVQKALICAQYNSVDIELPKFEIGKDNKTDTFKAKNPLQKVPVLELPNGQTLFESNAIARYVARLRNDTGLLGFTAVEQGKVDQWIDFSQNELEPCRAVWLYQVLGVVGSNPKALAEAKKETENALRILDGFLLHNTFLAANHVTLADISVFCALVEPFQKLFAPKFLSQLTNLVRWFNTVHAQPQVSAIVGKIDFAKEEAQPPKAGKGAEKEEKKAEKAEKQEKKKEEPKKKEEAKPAATATNAAAEELDEDGVPRPVKKQSPLDLLPESPMGHIDVSKKLMFSVRPILPDFFEKHFPQFDDKGFSWWVCKYNYDSDNKVYFMTGNAVGGFLQRCDAVRKYALGVMNILGKDEDNGPYAIRGAWMFRGTGMAPEMTQENPDAEYYTWTKVDVSKPEGQKLIKEQFMGETLEGQTVLDRRYFK